MSDEHAEGISILLMIVTGCFFIFTLKSCIVESQKMDNEKVRIERNCPEQPK